ncbi:MAG: DUF72 domain-containing protein [Candidatus Njordarchaeales archaeon]
MIALGVKYWIGCSGYSYDDWIGRFYPSNIEKKDILEYYVKKFNTVEINSTFYQIPDRRIVSHWAARAPPYFRYSIKFYQGITHERKLYHTRPVIDKFLNVLQPLIIRGKVAVFLIQLPASIGKNLQKLESFINELPKGFKYAIEFRHHSWLTDDTFQLLDKYNIAYVIVDEPHLPPIVRITADFAYIRFHGRGRKVWYFYLYSEDELKPWAEKIKKEIEPSVKEIFIYFNNHFRAYAPRNASQFIKLLGLNFEDIVPVGTRQASLWDFG